MCGKEATRKGGNKLAAELKVQRSAENENVGDGQKSERCKIAPAFAPRFAPPSAIVRQSLEKTQLGLLFCRNDFRFINANNVKHVQNSETATAEYTEGGVTLHEEL